MRRRPELGPDLRVVGYEDTFPRSDAPFHWEERVSQSGRSYSVKVYDREAYTADHMAKSAETGRLVRWVVRLSDGSAVSHDGVFRIRDRVAWERDIRPRVARLRGEKREQAIADALWELLSPEEREAMVASVSLDDYADGRGERQALEDLFADLRTSGSLLALVDADWPRRIRDHYAIRHLGGPQRSEAWASATWRPWLRYFYDRAGLPLPAEIDPARIVGLRKTQKTSEVVPAVWWDALAEYFANARGARLAEAPAVASVLWQRLGGLPDALELADFPPASQLALRQQVHALRDARAERMDLGLAPPEWHPAQTPGYYFRALTGPEFLRRVWNATRYERKANGRARPARDMATLDLFAARPAPLTAVPPPPPRRVLGPGTADPVRPRLAPAACPAPTLPAPLTRRHHGYVEAYGKEAAARHRNYLGGYTIKKTDRGVNIQGASPDGRLTGTCDRCGTAISDVFVFADASGKSLMHVGIDCAEKMGVPLEVLKQIAREMRWLKGTDERAARRLSREEAERMVAAERRATLEANRETVAELDAFSRDPNATEWDRRMVESVIRYIANNGAQWLADPQSIQELGFVGHVEAIRDRLALARTSRHVGVVGKPFAKPLRAYRNVVVIQGAYGDSYLSFLTDDEGNAFFVKGSKPVERGKIVRATWTVKGHGESREGVPETVLERPRKGVLVTPVGHRDRKAPVYAGGYLEPRFEGDEPVDGEDPEEYARPREEPF